MNLKTHPFIYLSDKESHIFSYLLIMFSYPLNSTPIIVIFSHKYQCSFLLILF